MNKKGAEKYYIAISLILGIIVVAIVLFFLFNEYFGEKQVDWETCRQSIILRNTVPRTQRIATAKLEETLNAFPLKCKTQVIDVDSENPEEVAQVIADTMSQCWYLFGEGNYHIFPQGEWGGLSERKDCPVCARIHFSTKTKESMDFIDLRDYFFSHDLNGNELEIELWTETRNGIKYYAYAENSYAKYLNNYNAGDKLFLGNPEQITKGEDSMRAVIDPNQGDLLISVYFYTNKEILAEWKFLGVQYEFSYPFYFQSSIDDLGNCDIATIPA